MTDGSQTPLVTADRAFGLACLVLGIGAPLWLLAPEPQIASENPARPVITPLRIFDAQAPGKALEAPLFNAERSVQLAGLESEAPAEPAVVNTVPVAVGLITGRRTSGLALLKSANGETVVAKTGDVIDGWTIAAIGSGSVTIRKGSEERALALSYENKNAQPEAGSGSASASTGN
jgi:hypothetical protein